MKIGIMYRLMHRYLPKAITFDPTIGFPSSIPFQKQGVRIFPEEIFPGISKFHTFLQIEGGRDFYYFLLSAWFLYRFLSLPNTKTHTQKTQKTHQILLILLSSPTTQGIFLIPNLHFLGSTLWIWGLGVQMQLFQLSSTSLTF